MQDTTLHVAFVSPYCCSWLWLLLRLSMFLMTLAVLRRTCQIVWNAPLLTYVWWFSPDNSKVVGFWEKDHKDKVQFSLHHSEGAYYGHDLCLLMLTWYYAAEAVIVRFSSLDYFFICFSALYLLERSHYAQHILKKKKKQKKKPIPPLWGKSL